MAQEHFSTSFVIEGRKPLRVEILRGTGGKNPYFKKGQFGYVVGANTAGGMYFVDRDWDSGRGISEPGEVAFLVSKTTDGRGGALWFSTESLRFTKAPKDPLRELSDEERVVLDMFLMNGNGGHKKEIETLIPDASRRGYVKMLAAQLKSGSRR